MLNESGTGSRARIGFDRAIAIAIPYLLVALAGLLRLELSHPYNAIPVFSILLFFGALRPRKEFLLPLAALTGIDVFLTVHQYGYPLVFSSFLPWAWYGMVMLLGAGALRGRRSLRRVAASTLLASISFFLASNFAVWAGWQMYPRTFSGLVSCYVAALPFFRNNIVSELACGLLVFGLSYSFRGVASRLAGQSVGPQVTVER